MRDNMVCCYCGKKCIKGDSRSNDVVRGDIATLDHIVAQKILAESATNDAHFSALRKDPKNLVVACMACNSSKQHIDLYVWCAQTSRDYASIIAEISRRIVLPVIITKNPTNKQKRHAHGII